MSFPRQLPCTGRFAQKGESCSIGDLRGSFAYDGRIVTLPGLSVMAFGYDAMPEQARLYSAPLGTGGRRPQFVCTRGYVAAFPLEAGTRGPSRHNTETGLDYFGARYFSGAQGRWTSPDWSARPEPVPYAKLDDPQTLNLYGYLSNNPVATTDPDGHGFWGDLRDNAADFVNGVARGAAASATVGTMPGSGPSSSDTVLNRVGQAVGSGIVGYIGTTAAQVGGAGAVLTSPTAIGAVAGSAVAATGVLAVGGAIKNLGAIITTPMQMGALDKSPKGPGTVPKDQRAPQRVATPGQKEDMRANQGGTCANCGQSVKEGEGIGHHYPERHADGGKDMVLVCKDCHVNELHK